MTYHWWYAYHSLKNYGLEQMRLDFNKCVLMKDIECSDFGVSWLLEQILLEFLRPRRNQLSHRLQTFCYIGLSSEQFAQLRDRVSRSFFHCTPRSIMFWTPHSIKTYISHFAILNFSATGYIRYFRLPVSFQRNAPVFCAVLVLDCLASMRKNMIYLHNSKIKLHYLTIA